MPRTKFSREDKQEARKALDLRPVSTPYRGVEITHYPNVTNDRYRATVDGKPIAKDDLDKLFATIDDHLAKSRTLSPITALLFNSLGASVVSVNSITQDFKGVNVTFTKSSHSRWSGERDAVKKSDIYKHFLRTDTDGLFHNTGDNRDVAKRIEKINRASTRLMARKRDEIQKLTRITWEEIEDRRIKPKKG